MSGNEDSAAGGLPADVVQLCDSFDAAEASAWELVQGLSEELGTRQPDATSWSVAHCLDHLAVANRVYLAAMVEPARLARERKRLRRRPVRPGWLGRIFVKQLESPGWWARLKAPGKIRPQPSPELATAYADFVASHGPVREFLLAEADLDLARIGFPNPFIPGLRFSLATGMHVLATHEHRHLRQAWRVRRLLEGRAAS